MTALEESTSARDPSTPKGTRRGIPDEGDQVPSDPRNSTSSPSDIRRNAERLLGNSTSRCTEQRYSYGNINEINNRNIPKTSWLDSQILSEASRRARALAFLDEEQAEDSSRFKAISLRHPRETKANIRQLSEMKVNQFPDHRKKKIRYMMLAALGVLITIVGLFIGLHK